MSNSVDERTANTRAHSTLAWPATSAVGLAAWLGMVAGHPGANEAAVSPALQAKPDAGWAAAADGSATAPFAQVLVDMGQVATDVLHRGQRYRLLSEPGGPACPWFHRLVWDQPKGQVQKVLEPCGAYIGWTSRGGTGVLLFEPLPQDDEARRRSQDESELHQVLLPQIAHPRTMDQMAQVLHQP